MRLHTVTAEEVTAAAHTKGKRHNGSQKL